MKNYFINLPPFKRRYLPIIISLSIIYFLSIIFIFLFPTISHNLILSPDNTTKNGWPARLSAPYIDMSSWVDTASAYSINGAPNLSKIAEESGFAYFNLGFIQPDTSTPLETDGTIRWGWGGYYSLSKSGSDNYQYNGILSSINSLRDMGGDYAISVGGQLGSAPWAVTQNQNALEKFYEDIIDTYTLKRLDLDIEESNQDYSQNVVNAKAIKNVQDKTGVEITLTIPIMPSGWEQKQIDIIKAYIDNNVDVLIINSMTMCYGTGVEPTEDYGTASVRAMNNAKNQLVELYSDRGILLTNDQAYLKLGATFSIGYESNLYPEFTLSMAQTIVNDAKKHNYGLLSMWSMGRDAKLEYNSAITEKYTFSEKLKEYIDN